MKPFRGRRLVALFAVIGLQATADEARLTIDGEAYNVPLGEQFAVRVNGERVTMQIDPQKDRLFDETGVSFRYPTALTLSQNDNAEEVRVWSFQGQAAAILLQRYGADIDPVGLLDVLVENLPGERVGEPQKVKLTAPQAAYTGVQVRTQSGGTAAGRAAGPATESVQNVFTFANQSGVFALLVQDTRLRGEGDSAEYVEALRLLGDSLKAGRPPTPRGDPPPAGSPPRP